MVFKNKQRLFYRYLCEAPLPLVIERSFECAILREKDFSRPILDIGCGDGIFSHILFDETIDVGIDPNAVELARAKRFGTYREYIHCFGNKVPKPKGYFKTIFTNSVLEHIPDLDGVLKECNRLLAPGGRMYITVPTDMFDRYSMVYVLLSALRLRGLAEKYRRFFNRFWQHHHFYNAAGWEKLFKRNGFKVADTREYNSKAICLLNDMLAPLSICSFLSRRIFKRWFFVPVLRRLTAVPLTWLFKRTAENDMRRHDCDCGLIFFEIRKAKAK
ncbi:MAG: class I SAM-dependent methyltransferase [Spirochaetota bacterium]